jgi:uncharacterized protein YaaN involved in tellurite resistance
MDHVVKELQKFALTLKQRVEYYKHAEMVSVTNTAAIRRLKMNMVASLVVNLVYYVRL